MSDRLQNAVAIIGMAGRFPGAGNVEQFWQNLCAGREAVENIPERDLEDGLTAVERGQGRYVAARGLLENVDLFDAEFFRFLPREAELTDPQQRMLMECAWEAFENAGYDPAAVQGSVGVFAGASINTYLLLNLASDRKFREEFTRSYQVGSFPALVGNAHDFVATRISYKLDLRGPAMTVQSACSTSLVAVAQAWQSLVNYQSDLALAGASSISFPQRRGYFYNEGGMVSPDGHCRPFDADAAGTVFGAGAGMVLLKRAEEAIADGDHIYALVLGAGINNDGSDKIGFAAPSSKGQADAVAIAHAVAGVDAASIGYVECHGTGTPLGDPIEVSALASVFAEPRTTPCLLSSVKGNVGHLDVAAGMAGLMKAALSLERERIPGTLHYRAPNSRLNLEATPFVFSGDSTSWPREEKNLRRAGVSAFGVGGTNVHLVLEEAPAASVAPSVHARQVLCLSARTETALDAQCLRLAEYLETETSADVLLPDIAYTLAAGRRAFPHRLAVTVDNASHAAAQLKKPSGIRSRHLVAAQAPRVALLFPGQGSQYPGMGEELYRTEAFYRRTVNDCFDRLQTLTGLKLKDVLYPETTEPSGKEQAASTLQQTQYAQPALFVTSYAVARLWMHWGVVPEWLVGHSVGEIAAACVAGVFSLDDALLFVARRGEWMQAMPPGTMLAVRMQPEQLQRVLPAEIQIAAINSPVVTVVSGPTPEIEKLAAKLEADKIVSRQLATSHAFHSSMMEPVVERLRGLLASMTLRAPEMQIISTVTGETLTAEQATSPEYWARHCRVAVNFRAAAETLVGAGVDIALEVGAGETLATLFRQHLPRGTQAATCTSLPGPTAASNGNKPDWEIIASTAGSLWSYGIPVDWSAYYAAESRRRVPLPTYPFERKRYWVDRKETVAGPVGEPPATNNSIQNGNATIPPQSGNDGSNILIPALENEMSMQTPGASAPQSIANGARAARFRQEVAAMLEDLSGLELTADQFDSSFPELGFDSLFLTQAAQKLQATYGVKIAFRQLLDALSSIGLVAEYLDAKVPPETFSSAVPSSAPHSVSPIPAIPNVQPAAAFVPGAGSVEQQLQAMQQWIQSQLQMLQPAATQAVEAPKAAVEENALHRRLAPHSHSVMTAKQRDFLDSLIARYCRKTAQSKAFTQQHRRTLADPRVVSGFRPEWKEMVYSIVSSRSHGSKLWDIDGNEYIDLLNGFGPTMFGHSPEFVTEAIRTQMAEGFAIGPQTPLAGKAADLLTEMTGTERVTFCNTGSEAVMAAMRLARTVTGRDRIVFFSGDYHGQFDEVLAKQLRRKGEVSAQPSAPGIPRANLDNITVLDYGTDESLAYIEQHANELAAVLIEPVQSRHPHLQPKEFLTRVREITRRSGTAFVFDEVVTGFRIHPRGAQGYYGIDADMATYGKVVAGGMPIGILAGKAAFMDALDGGHWEFGDRSVPEAGVTFFAGTFVRHPLAMAALCATLEHIRTAGDAMYAALNARADRFAERLLQVLDGTTLHLEHCGSVMYMSIPSELRFGGLLHYLLREKGVFLLEGFPLYLTTEHSDADLDRVVRAFQESITALQSCELLPGAGEANEKASETITEIPLTAPQMEVLLAAQVSDEASCAFNESFRVDFSGALDSSALQKAWRGLLDRHDALRMSLTAAGDRMQVHPSSDVEIPAVDLRAQPEEARRPALETLIAFEGLQPFDLVHGPLVRAQIVALAADRHVLVVTAHHLVCDGWSVNVLVGELGQLYSAARRGVPADLPEAMQFSTYAQQQAAALPEQEEADLAYWKAQLMPLPETLTLPTEGNRPTTREFAGATLFTQFSGEFAASLRKAGAAAGTTLFTMLLAGWQILQWRLSGNADPVTMIPAAAQAQIADKTLVGHCVHLLPVRSTLTPEMNTGELLRALKPVVLDAYDHQTATYGSIVRALDIQREPGRLPLSEVQFNLEKLGKGAAFDGLTTEVRANGKRAVNFDLFLNIVDTDNGLRLECDYNTGIYDASTIVRWLGSYRTVLEGMVAAPTQSIAVLPLIEPDVQAHLEAVNATATGPLPAENIPELITRAFDAMPGQPAADFYGLTLDRKDLSQRSDRLAAWLLRHDAGPGSLVGIYMDRSLEMLVAILGVMKAGAAYVPLDPMFPPSRIEQIVAETRVPVMLTLSGHLDTMPKSNARVLALDTRADVLAREPMVKLPRIAADARAYVIFTSGSTGRPKGVELTHASVVNLLVDLSRRLDMKPSDRWLAVTTLSFDISVLEMLLPLVSGGTVAIAHRDDVADGARLMELLQAARATVLQATPVTWRMLLEHGFTGQPGLKMLCGGEAWTPAVADQLLGSEAQPGTLWNMYGPTETTVWSSVTEVHRGSSGITIGPPMANTRFYVLDPRMQPVPPGVPGELFIAGAGVARGYFERPDLTAEKFLADPFHPGERMYRTGDEVRQMADGPIQFLGRLDQQVKLRGFRIELGEIETALRAIPEIGDAVVVLRPDGSGEPMLAAYYTGGEAYASTDLRKALRGSLPVYMIPTILMRLEALPLTPNGKLDRRALPDPDAGLDSGSGEKLDGLSPATPTEAALAEIFCEVLGCAQMGSRTSLLDCGADSLRMFQIASRAHHRGLAVTVKQLMQLHTVEAVAAAIDGEAARKDSVAASAPLRKVSRAGYRITA